LLEAVCFHQETGTAVSGFGLSDGMKIALTLDWTITILAMAGQSVLGGSVMESVDTSGKALVDFWRRAGEKGDVNPNTASSYRSACLQALSVLDDWQSIDVRTLDPEAVMRRFVNKNSAKFKQVSLQAYARRWPIALKSFLEFADNPTTWKAPASDKPPTPREPSLKEPEQEVSFAASFSRAMAAPTAAGLVEYPFPLREGRLAYLRLPVDLRPAEVKRLTAFMNTLAMDSDEPG
jgi:hypothetical protein